MSDIRRDYTNVGIRMRDWDDGRFAVEVTESPVGRMRDPDYVNFDYGVFPLIERISQQRTGDPETHLSISDLRELGEMLAS